MVVLFYEQGASSQGELLSSVAEIVEQPFEQL